MQEDAASTENAVQLASDGHAPETVKLCGDVKQVLADVTWSYSNARSLNTSIWKACDTVRETIDMCNKASNINTATTTANNIAKPLKHFPYIGPLLKFVQPVLERVSVSTKPVKRLCDLYLDRLKLKQFRDKCHKVEPYMNSLVARTTLILADVELADSLWCNCMNEGTGKKKKKHPVMQTLTQSGCDCIAGKNGCRNQQAKFGKCTDYTKWTCPPDPLIRKYTNAQHIGEKYSCVAPQIEKVSKAINDQVRNLKAAIAETIREIKKLMDWMKFFNMLDFLRLPSIKPIIDAFNAVLSPIYWLADKIKWILEQRITIQMPGCEEAQNEEQLSVLLQQKTGMTLKEAMRPVTKEEQAAAAKKFADSIVYRDIQTVYDEFLQKDMKRFHAITQIQNSDKEEDDSYQCRDMTDEEIEKESEGKYKSCSHDHNCDTKEPFHQACPKTCGLCPKDKQEADASGACKVAGQADPEATVGAGMVGFFPVTGHEDEPADYCMEGKDKAYKGYHKYSCKGGTLSSSPQVFCMVSDTDEEEFQKCYKCSGSPALPDNQSQADLQDTSMQSKSSTAFLQTSQGAKEKWGGRRRRWGHRWHVHIPHHHHFHIPHRHHFHIPHRHHIHIPHRHHFHAAAIVKSIGAGIVAVGKKIGELYCYKITFSFMDIIEGLSNLMSWMMKPIDDFIAWVLKGLGITLPSFNIPWPSFNFNLPSFNFNFDLDFLSFNWPQLEWVLKLLSGISIEIPNLIPKCIREIPADMRQ